MKYMNMSTARTALGLASSVMYCLRSAITLWRTACPQQANETEIDEMIDESLKQAREVNEHVVQPFANSLTDGKMTEEEYLDIVKNIRELYYSGEEE